MNILAYVVQLGDYQPLNFVSLLCSLGMCMIVCFLYFSYLSTSAATTNPSEGAVPTTSPSNHTGYWVGIGWVEFDKNFGKRMSEQKNEGPMFPPPQYEDL